MDIERVVSELLDEATQQHAVAQLAALVDEVEGASAVQLGRTIRDFGALPELLNMLQWPLTRQPALRVIGNLASEAVDRNARLTKEMIYELKGFERILPLIWEDEELILVYALGAIQNLCTYPEYAQLMQKNGARERLQALIALPGSRQRQHFARGCLNNMQVVIEMKEPAVPPDGVPSRKLEEQHPHPVAPWPRPAPSPPSTGKPRALQRYSVAPDNSCLFTSCALLCEAARESELAERGYNLRVMCADSIAQAPDADHWLVLLGVKSVEEYASWIQDERHWGGESEIVMIAKHYQVEVVVASCESLRLLRYGVKNRPKWVIYLLYTGQHYDPLIGPSPYGVRRFPVNDDPEKVQAREEAAIQIATEQRETAEKERAAREQLIEAGAFTSIPGYV